MKILLHLACASIVAATALTAAPTRAADATLERDRPRVPLAEAEHWALRPTRAALPRPRTERVVALSDLPAERRRVRIVYQGYNEAAPLVAH